jgi:hypothetical protein
MMFGDDRARSSLVVRTFGRLVVSAGAFLLGAAACTTTAGTVAAPTPPPAEPAADAGEPVDEEPTAPPADACGAITKKSKCKPANEGSIVRGVVKFDPTKLKAGAKPSLRVFLHHQVLAVDEEAKLGGHPHTYDSYDVDMEKGEARFQLDLCLFGTAMYSEENCGFNIVAMIDDDGGNDPDARGQTALIPRKGKLVKMVPVEVSCHKTSPCLEITADCLDGDACTTFEPTTQCACAASSCPSDDRLCERM